MKKILLLGASGSIGQSTLNILRKHQDKFLLVGVSVYSSNESLEKILQEWPSIRWAGTAKNERLSSFSHITLFSGDNYITNLIKAAEADLVVNAIVGYAGLEASITTLNKKVPLALANKESLVVAGDYLMELSRKNKVDIIPIDSEHSALFQCLIGENSASIEKVIITCSGGSVRNIPEEKYPTLTIKEVLSHPTWNMGAKITVDSATLVNKAFEIIEAHYLFSLSPEQIEVLIHPESLVHGMVIFKDSAVKASIGSPNMELPIIYALNYPNPVRLALNHPVNFTSLNFSNEIGYRKKMIEYGYLVIKKKGTYGAAFNAVNEVVVQAFLANRLHFGQIFGIISKVMDEHVNIINPSLLDIKRTDQEVRNYTKKLIEKES